MRGFFSLLSESVDYTIRIDYLSTFIYITTVDIKIFALKISHERKKLTFLNIRKRLASLILEQDHKLLKLPYLNHSFYQLPLCCNCHF